MNHQPWVFSKWDGWPKCRSCFSDLLRSVEFKVYTMASRRQGGVWPATRHFFWLLMMKIRCLVSLWWTISYHIFFAPDLSRFGSGIIWWFLRCFWLCQPISLKDHRPRVRQANWVWNLHQSCWYSVNSTSIWAKCPWSNEDLIVGVFSGTVLSLLKRHDSVTPPPPNRPGEHFGDFLEEVLWKHGEGRSGRETPSSLGRTFFLRGFDRTRAAWPQQNQRLWGNGKETSSNLTWNYEMFASFSGAYADKQLLLKRFG